jgi:putative DNA primase/helicase
MNNKSMLSAALDFGLLVNYIEKNEQVQRVATLTKPRSKNGWYIAYGDFLIMGDWLTGTTETHKPDGYQQTRQDNERIKQSIERHKKEKSCLQNQTANYARQTYESAAEVAVHPYLTSKGLDSSDGLKIVKNQLLVPLVNLMSQQVENLQRIFPDGAKRFLKHGRITGLCYPCGFKNGLWSKQLEKVFICEGFATAATIYQMTQQPVLAAMNANNLLPVAKLALKKWPGSEIVIAGDDDYLTEQSTGINPGKAKAFEAANLLGVKVSFPPFLPKHKKAGLSDWNDYWLDSNRGAAQ